MKKYQIISADGHLEGAVDWTKWVPSKYKDAVPKLVTKEDGRQYWMIDWAGVQDEALVGQMGTVYCGLPYDEYTPKTAHTYFLPDGSPRPGAGDAVQRLQEQDIDGIDAEVLYVGSGFFLAGGAGVNKDNDAHLALIRAYNDRLADYCSIAPDRLIGNALLPRTGVADAIAEMERCKKLGLRAVCLQMWPNGGEQPAAEDDRFWAAALDMDMKLSPHGSFGGTFAGMAALPVVGRMSERVGNCIGYLLFNHVFDRFPKLKFYFAETQAGWLPYQMSGRMDEFFLRWYTYNDVRLQKLPSQYYRDHCRFSFIQDRMAMKYRYDIGLEMLMWGTDFPHGETTFPNTPRILGELFDGVPENERRQVQCDNVVEFFGLDPERTLTPTPQRK